MGILAGFWLHLPAPALAQPPAAVRAPIPVRVVVVTTFELGADTGDLPGEFQNWVERFPLSQKIPAPATYHEVLRYNPELHVLGMVSGEGPTRMAAAMTSLILDPRFDLSHAYFILAGIAGIDPHAGTVGSAAWARYVVNGGAAHFIDPRQVPADWPDGFTPVQGDRPYQQPRPPVHSIAADMAYALRPSLVQWAYRLTRNTPLPDSPALKKQRQRYVGFPRAQEQPEVMLGDTISGETFWVGSLMNGWAERWVAYWTGGAARMVTTAEEDIALCQVLHQQGDLQAGGHVDPKRLLILRTASNFDMPPQGVSAASMLAEESHEEGMSGLKASTTAAYEVASPVVRELATHWAHYEKTVP
ncbi:purine nucleoside permease [Oecophyllibacter saccharovorans]|uniref:Purine nucleoside permease n=1 Tax=Oecophyllibacter saccharovorans TaxID=2558360 RepID=A0A506URL5_9PROT|nr:purine nucleoside permease [Oecophyllibacter saccharovorans]